MKKIFLIAVIGFSFLNLSSCRDNNNTENEELDNSAIIGTWSLKKSIDHNGINGNPMVTMSPNSCTAQSTYQYGENNYFITYYDYENGQCQITSESERTYTYDSTTKILKIGDSDKELIVQKLTDTELEIIIQIHDLNDDGVNDKIVNYYSRVQ